MGYSLVRSVKDAAPCCDSLYSLMNFESPVPDMSGLRS